MSRKEIQTPQSHGQTSGKPLEQLQGPQVVRQQVPPQQPPKTRVVHSNSSASSLQAQQVQQQQGGRKPHTGPSPNSQPPLTQSQTAANRTHVSSKSQVETVQEEVRNVLWGMSDDQQVEQAPPQRQQQRPSPKQIQQVQQGQPIQQSQQGQQIAPNQRVPQPRPPPVKQAKPVTRAGTPLYVSSEFVQGTTQQQPPAQVRIVNTQQAPQYVVQQPVDRQSESYPQQSESLLQENAQLRQQIQEYRAKYEQLVDQLMNKEDTAANLRDLAIEYERLEAERNNLFNMVREIQAELDRARTMEQNYNMLELELGESKDRQQQYENIINERNEENAALKNYIQQATDENAQLMEEREKLLDEREKIRLYVEEQQKRVYSYQTYTQNVANENKQLLQLNEQFRIDQENLMAELNRRINEDRTAASSNYEIDRLNSLLRIKENEIAQLLTRINNDASASAVNQEAEYRVTTLEKRVEVLNNEIEKYNAALITKNKEICELKSQNFELDKLSKNNIELKSAVYEVEKLTEILTAKSSELANLKASHQMLEKKFQMAEASSKELEALRGSVSQIEQLREQIYKRDAELSRLKQTTASKESVTSDLQSEKEQLKKRIQSLEQQLDSERDDHRLKVNQLDQKIAEQDKRHRHAEKQLRDKLGHLESERYTYKSSDQDRLDRIRFLETQLAESTKLVEHERSEHFNMRKSYEDRLYSLEGGKSELESRLNHLLYDVELKENEIARLEAQLKNLAGDFNDLRNENIQNVNSLNEIRLHCQKTTNELENRKAQFQDAMRRATKENETYQETIKLQELKLEEIRDETLNVRKSPVRDSSFREQQAVQRQLHELQLQVQHFQQLQLDSNRMADLNKELLVQQNQIDGLQRQLEEKKTQEQARIREHEQSRLKLENTIIELQKQLQHEQHHHSELKRSVEQERFISEQSRVISQKHEELKLKEKELQARQNSQTPIRQHQIHNERWNSELSQFSHVQQAQPTQPSQLQAPKRPTANVPGNNKRTEVFVELRKENEGLKAKLNSFSNRAAEHESLVEQIIEVHSRLTGFCQRIGVLLNEGDNTANFGTDHNLKAAIGELTNRLRRYKQENEELRKSSNKSRQQVVKVMLLPEGNPLEQLCQELLEENDQLRNSCDQFEGRIKQYQNQFIKLAHSPPSERPLITNPFDMRNTIRGLEEKVEYFKLKNTEQEERVHQLLRLNSELKGELESSKSKSNEKDAEFYRQQFEFSERNLGTVQEKLKQALEELSYVRNSELAKVSQLNTELAGRLSQTQASIFDLNLKINTSQTEKAYAEDERRQLIGKLEVVNIELKRYKQNEREQSSTIESLSSQLQEVQVQRGLMINKIQQLSSEVNRLQHETGELQVQLSLKSEEKYRMKQCRKLIEQQLSRTNETVDSLSLQLNNLRGDLIRSETVLNETDSIMFYLDRAKASISEMETQLPELRGVNNSVLSFSLSEAISKTASIFREMQFSRNNIRDSRKSLNRKPAPNNTILTY